MSVEFNEECRAAIDLAKSALSDGDSLGIPVLLEALYHATPISARFPELKHRLIRPEPRRPPSETPVAEDLKVALREFLGRTQPITPIELFTALVNSPAGAALLQSRGLSDQDRLRLVASLTGPSPAEPGWRDSPERKQAMEALGSFGRMLTAVQQRPRSMVGIDEPLRSLLANLSRMRQRSTILVGQPGTGKTALVYELARRLVEIPEQFPARLRDLDIFELSPAFLRAGASVVGQYDERIKALLQVLQAHPKIVLFVDEVHSLLQSGMHRQSPFSDANESLKGPLARGEITLIGCTTLAEYRHYLEPDKALTERFSVIRLEPPSRDATVSMLAARQPQMEQYFHPLRIPSAMLRRVVELTDDFLPGHYQPRKSLRLLDEACALCGLQQPPVEELTEAVILDALENKIGHGIARRGRLNVEEVLGKLRAKIVGQDEVLGKIAEAFVAGLGAWRTKSGPRGVLLFGGPTGVGKTETARALAALLGDADRGLLRIDCNLLQGSGLDSGPAIARLLGVAPGYVGYSQGEGGQLSRIRDFPESVVLFDEFEKADPGVGQLLLQIMDEGQIEDSDGNLLDFRRAFIIFTTNAGCSYEHAPHLGFLTGKEAVESPTVETTQLLAELRGRGLGEEFFGRIDHIFLFGGLTREVIPVIIERQLAGLARLAAERGLQLVWQPEIVPHLTAQWNPHFGVRALEGLLRSRVRTQLGVAEAQGEMDGVVKVQLACAGPAPAPPPVPDVASGVRRYRQGDTMVIELPK